MATFTIDHPRDTDDQSTLDGSSASTLSQVTMWENLLSLISSATVNNSNVKSSSIKGEIGQDAVGDGAVAIRKRERELTKTLVLSVVICFTLPLVGIGVLSARTFLVKVGEIGEQHFGINENMEGLSNIKFEDMESSDFEGNTELDRHREIEESVEHQSFEEFIEAMTTESCDMPNAFVEVSSDLDSAEIINVSAEEASLDLGGVNYQSFDELLEDIAADWCALNQAPTICLKDEDSEAHYTDEEPDFFDLDSSINLVSKHHDELDSTGNASELATNISTGISFVVNPGMKELTRKQLLISKRKRSTLTALVNPNYLQFIVNINIRYEAPTPVTGFPAEVKHAVVAKVLPQKALHAYSARKMLDDIYCQHNEIVGNSSSFAIFSAQTLGCHSTAQFWISFESLLNGLNDAELHHYQYYVPTTIRFLLFQESEDLPSRPVDWFDLTAKVPLNSEHERWLLGHYESSYIVDLEDTFIVNPEQVSFCNRNSWNDTHLKKAEHVSQRLGLDYLRAKNHTNDQSYSESQEEEQHQDFAWQKLLYGCLSGIVCGFGIVAPAFLPDMTPSSLREENEAVSSDEDRASNNTVTTHTYRSKQFRFTTVSPSITKELSTVREVIDQNYQCQQDNGINIRNIEPTGEHDGNFHQVPSLPPLYPKQNHRMTRKRMYSRSFGTEFENSKTPRRCNLSSNQTNTAHTEALGARNETFETAVADSHASERRSDDSPFANSSTVSSLEEPINQQYTVSVNENESETISPPVIERIIDPHPFSDPPPFPSSMVKPQMATRQEETEANTNTFERQDTIMDSNSKNIDDKAVQEKIDSKRELLQEESARLSKGNTAHCDSSPTTRQENEEVSPLLVVEKQDETSKPETAVVMEGIAPNSPVPSDADLTFDNYGNSSNLNAEESVTEDIEDQSFNNNANLSEPYDENQNGSNIPDNKDEMLLGIRAQPISHRPSPRKRARRSYLIKAPKKLVNNIATAARSESSLSMTADRPVARRSGAHGQSKKFAASSVASDEFSFKSGSTFHDCGAERIGQRVAKDLNGVTTFGTVTDYNGADSPEYWRVVYDDGNTHKEYFRREELLDAILHYKANKTNDPYNEDQIDEIVIPYSSTEQNSQPSTESQVSGTKSDDTWSRKEKKARDKKRARAERRLLRTAKKPGIHKAASALIPLSRAIDEPVWEFTKKRKSI